MRIEDWEGRREKTWVSITTKIQYSVFLKRELEESHVTKLPALIISYLGNWSESIDWDSRMNASSFYFFASHTQRTILGKLPLPRAIDIEVLWGWLIRKKFFGGARIIIWWGRSVFRTSLLIERGLIQSLLVRRWFWTVSILEGLLHWLCRSKISLTILLTVWEKSWHSLVSTLEMMIETRNSMSQMVVTNRLPQVSLIGSLTWLSTSRYDRSQALRSWTSLLEVSWSQS